MKTNKSPLFFSFFFFPLFSCWAQFSGSIQTSYQLGNLPQAENSNRSNLYNQLNLQYNQEKITIGLRMENYMVDEPNEYNHLSQKYLRYQGNNLQITVGNFYEILGRGVLLRSYEIPGSVYEDGGTRQRYAFYKDIKGISLQYNNDFLQAKMIYGRSLNNLIPPAFGKKVRRPILLQGGEISFISYSQFQPGILLLRSEYNDEVIEYGGFNAQGFFDCGLHYYAEYTQNLDDQFDLLQFGKKSPHAFYGSITYSFDFVSASLEYKDYNRYSLSFNDPPPLVREHSYTLLNRSTHDIEPENEKGYQAELLFNIGDFNTATFNHAAATNNFGNGDLNFYEYYADINYYLNETWITNFFIDFAHDDLINQNDRWTLGASSENELFGLWSYSGDFQYQVFDRKYKAAPLQNHSGENILLQGSLNYAPDFSLTVSFEQSKDPLETDTLLNGDRSKRKNRLGFNMAYRYDQNNTLSLFLGERRGGTACSGGICYQVQPFKGLEFRLNSRF